MVDESGLFRKVVANLHGCGRFHLALHGSVMCYMLLAFSRRQW